MTVSSSSSFTTKSLPAFESEVQRTSSRVDKELLKQKNSIKFEYNQITFMNLLSNNFFCEPVIILNYL